MKTHLIVGMISIIGLILQGKDLYGSSTYVLDDFSSGDITVSSSVSSSWGNPVQGVFGGNRTILLLKADESSATSMAVGSGVLTWNETAAAPTSAGADYAWVGYGTLGTDIDLSSYNAFRITVVSAPPGAGQLSVDYYWSEPGWVYGVYANVTLPTSGTVDIPFPSFLDSWHRAGTFPPIDFAHAYGVALEFRGNQLAQGTYVLDDFQAVSIAVPAPGAILLATIGAGLVGWLRKRETL